MADEISQIEPASIQHTRAFLVNQNRRHFDRMLQKYVRCVFLAAAANELTFVRSPAVSICLEDTMRN